MSVVNVRDPRSWVLLGFALIALILGLSAVERLTAGARSALPTEANAVSASASTTALAETNGAIQFWEQRVARDPRDFLAENKLGGLYLRRAQLSGDIVDFTRAEAALKSSLAKFPRQNREAEVLLPYVYSVKHEFTQALTLASSAVTAYPQDPFAWGVLGDAQLALGQYDEADRSYGRMLGIGPSLSAFTRTAHMAEVRGDLKRAAIDWQNALDVDGAELPETRAWARVEFGRFELSRGELTAAERAFRASLEVYPDNIHAIAGLAAASAARGDDRQAIKLYEQVVGRNPLPEYVIALGDVHARAGNQAAADRQYALVRLIGRLYHANGIRSDLPLILFEADHGGNPADVLARAEVAYRDRPSLWAADAYGWALYRAGKYEEARTHAETALSLGTQDASMVFHAGMIAEKRGDIAAARRYLEQALRINPTFHVLHAAEARAALNRLGGVR